MSTIAEVRAICQRLAPFGWGKLLKRHGLDIEAADLEKELYRDLSKTINRSIAGFEDFLTSGTRAIEPYTPCKSLLFHALASPDVHPGPANAPVHDEQAYASPLELDTLENFIFSTAHVHSGIAVRDEAFFADHFDPDRLEIAVFAYQYRTGSRSVNRSYADMAYSRTGVSRVGTSNPVYEAWRRGFWTITEDGSIPVLPARYGLFLAERRKAEPTKNVLTPRRTLAILGDASREFLFPVHKLFPGAECIGGLQIPAFSWQENHLSEKLNRAFRGLPHRFAIDRAPFIRSSNAGDKLAEVRPLGATCMVSAVVHPNLLQVAVQDGQTVHFTVPADDGENRFSTSYQLPLPRISGRRVRKGPEYINIRFEKTADGSMSDLNLQFGTTLAEESAYIAKIAIGGYEAVAFEDGTCDGCIQATFDGHAPFGKPVAPAYSLITAPDFFPLCDQAEIYDWITAEGFADQFAQGGPEPLAYERDFRPNPAIDLPKVGQKAFPAQSVSKTTTAIVGMSVFPTGDPMVPESSPQASFLPDAASGFYAPGWDVSQVYDEATNATYLSTFGLGSPFPEDSKLCAALNSFWPAVAPDVARTFLGLKSNPTSFPLLDGELGYHPSHPKVLSGSVQASHGWDGEQGPFFENGFARVNFADFGRSDYTANALAGLFSIKDLCLIDSLEWKQRMLAVRHCIQVLPPTGDLLKDKDPKHPPSLTTLNLITAEKVEDWRTEDGRMTVGLLGAGYHFVYAQLAGAEQLTPDRKRRQQSVARSFTCQLSETLLVWRDNRSGDVVSVNRSGIAANIW